MRLIDADELRELMYHEAFETDSDRARWDSGLWVRYKMFEDHLDECQTIEAEPVRHGHWENAGHDEWNHYRRCSVCGKLFANSNKTKFCSNCGSRMDEERRKNETK